MTIKELEEASGMSRANIRFYEKEGFLAPIRKTNGYREYSVQDLELLLKIKLLRSLSVSLDEIRAMMEGAARLDDVLQRKIDELEKEKKKLQGMQTVCRTMRAEQAAFGNLQAEKYLEQLHQLAMEQGQSEGWVTASRIHAPNRRFFARFMDVAVMELFCACILIFVFRVRLIEMGAGWAALLFTALVLAFLTEPYFLHWFGTTPGKAVFGLYIRKTDGSHLTVSEAKERLWEIVTTYMMAGGRSFSWEGSWAARKNYELQGMYWYGDGKIDLPWEKHNHSYTIAENTLLRAGLYIGILALSIVLHCVSDYALYPDFHQGNITAAEYAQNVNTYIDYYAGDTSYAEWELQPNGKWIERKRYDVTTVGSTDSRPPSCAIMRDTDGYVTGVAFHVEKSDRKSWIGDNAEWQAFLVGGLLCAEEDIGRFSKQAKQLLTIFREKSAESYSFTIADLEISCEVSYQGYQVSYGSLIPDSESEDKPHFEMDFVVRKIERD